MPQATRESAATGDGVDGSTIISVLPVKPHQWLAEAWMIEAPGQTMVVMTRGPTRWCREFWRSVADARHQVVGHLPSAAGPLNPLRRQTDLPVPHYQAGRWRSAIRSFVRG